MITQLLKKIAKYVESNGECNTQSSFNGEHVTYNHKTKWFKGYVHYCDCGDRDWSFSLLGKPVYNITHGYETFVFWPFNLSISKKTQRF